MLLAKNLKKDNAKLYHFEATDGKKSYQVVYRKFNGYQMPKKNGFETTIAIRKLGRSGVTPIIALTAGILRRKKSV
jgi:CheY-like chemotaxis protein